MDGFDRINKIREQQSAMSSETPPTEQDTVRTRTRTPLYKFLTIILIVVLLLTAVYAFLHPINKLKLKFLLYRSLTIEVAATSYGQYQTKDILVDGNLINFEDEYYELDGDKLFKYVKTGKNSWKRMPADEEWTKDVELGEILLDKGNYKRVKGRLFAWRLKNSVAETVDDLSSITVERDAGKIAIVGYKNGVKISMRFIMFGKTSIDPPWEAPGMTVE